MKQTNMRNIRVPQLLTDGSDVSEETNIRGYNWAKRTAVPTIDDYVVDPFETALKNNVLAAAMEAQGLSDGELLKARHVIETPYGDTVFVASAYQHSSTSHEAVLSRTGKFLRDCIDDNVASVHREFVRKTERGPHVSAQYLMAEMQRWADENTKLYNKQEVQVLNADSRKKKDLSTAVDEITVALDLKRFGSINPANARQYLLARGIKSGVEGFVKDYVEHVMEQQGIDAKDIGGQVAVDYELGDGSAVRYLFFPKMTSLSYGKVIDALTSFETENIVASTGDLVILHELGFKDPYSIGGRGPVDVSTERESAGLGWCSIERPAHGGLVKYSVLDNKHKGVYVRARDLLRRIDELQKEHSAGSTQLKVDFFPGAPTYLR